MAVIIRLVESFDNEAYRGATFDLSQLFDCLSVAMRKITIDNAGKVSIVDSLQTEKSCSVRWTMTTNAQAKVVSKSEVLLTQNGKSIIVRAVSPRGVKSFVISNDPPHSYDAPNKDSRRVGFDLSLRKKALLIVELVPIG